MKKPWLLLTLCMVFAAAHAIQAQTLNVDVQSLAFTSQMNGPVTSQTVNVTSSSAAVVVATPVEQTGTQTQWLSVSPTGGPTPIAMAVLVDPTNLPTGIYNGTIVVSVFGGSSTVTVSVKLTISTINVLPTSLSFVTAIGNTPTVQPITLTSSQQVTFTVAVATTSGGNWLGVSSSSGFVSSTSPTAVVAIPDSAVVPLLSAGTYQGSISITPVSGASLTPVVVPVSLTVTPAPAVTVNPTTVNIGYQIGGTANTPQKTVVLTTPSSQGIAFTTSASKPTWITLTPASGLITTGGIPVTIAYNPTAGLAAGNWPSTVSIVTPNGSPTRTDIAVNLQVSTQPILTVPSDTLNFTYQLGAASPAAQPVTITSTSGTAQAFTATAATTDGVSWLVAPSSASTGSPLNVSVNPIGLAPGTYNGTVTITGVGTANGSQQFPVVLKVNNDPAIVTDFKSLALAYQLGQAQNISQTIVVTSSNGVPLNYTVTSRTITCGSNWLALGGSTGTTTGQLTVAVNTAALTAGICTGSLSIAATNALTGAAAINSPLSIPITVTVGSSALLLISPYSPALFTASVGGAAAQGPLTFTLSSTSSDVLVYTVSTATSDGSGWLLVSPNNGQTVAASNKLTVSVQPAFLAAGTYTGSVTITAAGPGGAPVANSPLTISVTLLVTGGSLTLGQTSLTFKQAAGGPAPSSQFVNITSSGQQLGFTATAYTTGSTGNWLAVSKSGSTPGVLTVSVDGSQLQQGTYTGTIVVLSTTPNAGNSPAFLPVTLSIHAGSISASPPSLVFTEIQGSGAPPSQGLSVSGSPGALPFSASASTSGNGSWLGVSPIGGTTPTTLQVSIADNTLAVGSYPGSVTITSPGADGSPITVPVSLNVLAPHNLYASPTVLTLTAKPGDTLVETALILVGSSDGTSNGFSVSAVGGAWLGISPTSGSTPSTLTVKVNPTGLATGSYSGTIVITAPNAPSPVSVTINLVVGSPPKPTVAALANAASYGAGAIAPGENIVLFGDGIGPPQLTRGTVTNGVVDTVVAGTRVLFDGISAPVLYALSNQTSVMVPYGLSGRSTTSVVVEYQGVQSNALAYNVTPSAPGIYTQNSQGTGPGAILNQDYHVNLPGSPAPRGSVVAVYMTGEGYTIGGQDGAIATGLLSPALPVTATVDGIPATVTYAGTAPGIITGAMQVNVQIPLAARSGPAIPIVITIGSGLSAASTQAAVTISLQ